MKLFKNFNISVLLVDDSKVSREFMKDFLLNEGIESIILAKDGKEALDIFSNNSFHLVITDMEMPVCDGIELTKEIRKKSNTPIIVISSLSDSEKLIKLINFGVDGFISKPFIENNIRFQINRVLSPFLENIQISAKKNELEYKLKNYIKIVDESVITSTTDVNGIITYVSEAFCRTSGYTKDELIGRNHNIVRHKDMSDNLYSGLWKTIVENNIWEGEIKNKKKDGDYYWVIAKISSIYDSNKNKIGYIAIRQDITDKKRVEEISITDGLTNIYNRRYFDEIFPKLLNRAKRKSEYLAFVLMDVDYFKQYNDTYGHFEGDNVLISISKCLKEYLTRSDDMVFRLGGEEFGVVFTTDKKENALSFANSLKNSIEKLEIKHEKNRASDYITVSMGLICDDANNLPTFDEIYKIADKLLYKSKENGRNQITANW